MIKLAVIADDLTGANDTGVQFVKYGMRVQVLLDAEAAGTNAEKPDILVVDTDSRALTAYDAGAKAEKAARRLQATIGSATPVYKKVDSTLRGNLGAEIDAVMQECGCEWAVVAPAFPKTGRWTVGGYHLMNGLPLTETAIAKDPRTPVTEPVLPALLALQSRHKVGHVELRHVSAGGEALAAKIRELRQTGCKVVSFDATTEDHLLMIAQTTAGMPEKALWVGSAGLADALAKAYGWNLDSAGSAQSNPKEGPVLVVAGSVSPVTAGQVSVLQKESGVTAVLFNAARYFANSESEMKRCSELAKQALQNGNDVLLVSAADAAAVEDARSAGGAAGLTHTQVSARIAEALAMLVSQVISEKTAGIFLTGGDTAIAVCRQLGVGAIEVLAEVAPGIPLGQLVGGEFTGMRVVTKAGAFGADRAIVDSVNRLKRR